MIAAKVIDNIWSTRKDSRLNGMKLMLVEVLKNEGEQERFIAVDQIGSGIGDRVIVVTGSGARHQVGCDDAPVDAAVIGIIDDECEF